MRTFANALSFYIYVTLFLNPSPRGRDFAGSKALLNRCFVLAKLEYLLQIYQNCISKQTFLKLFGFNLNELLSLQSMKATIDKLFRTGDASNEELKALVKQEVKTAVQEENRQLRAEIDRLYKIVEKLTELVKK